MEERASLMISRWASDGLGWWAVFGVAVVGVGFAGMGSGPINGDAAVYMHQASTGLFEQRFVHVGYLVLAWGIGHWSPWGIEQGMDGVAAVCAGVITVSAGVLARRLGHRGVIAAGLAGAGVLPLASFAEVDLVWIALVLCAAWAPHVWCALLVGLAVLVSPATLLALPWLLVFRRDATPLWGAMVSIAVVCGASSGEWLWGDRGVWFAPRPRPWRAVQALVATAIGPAWVVVALHGRRQWLGIAALLPLLLAPPDTGAVVLVVVAIGIWGGSVGPVARKWVFGLLLADVVMAGGRWSERVRDVRDARELVHSVANALGPADGLVAPWTWGVRVSLVARNDPYALVWRSPDSPVGDQALRFCTTRLERVAIMAEPLVKEWGMMPNDTGWIWVPKKKALEHLGPCIREKEPKQDSKKQGIKPI